MRAKGGVLLVARLSIAAGPASVLGRGRRQRPRVLFVL